MSSDDSGQANAAKRGERGSVEFPQSGSGSPSSSRRGFGTLQSLTPILNDASRSPSSSLRRTSIDNARARSISLNPVAALSLRSDLSPSTGYAGRGDNLQDQKVLDDVNRALRLKARRDARTISQPGRPTFDRPTSMVAHGAEPTTIEHPYSSASGSRPSAGLGISPSPRTVELSQALNVEFHRRYTSLFTPLAFQSPALNPLAVIRFKRSTRPKHDRHASPRSLTKLGVRAVTGEWYLDANMVEEYIRHSKSFTPPNQPTSRPSSLRSLSSDSSALSFSGSGVAQPREAVVSPPSTDQDAHAAIHSLPTRNISRQGRQGQRPKRSSFLSSSGNSLRNMLLAARATSPGASSYRSPVDRGLGTPDLGSGQEAYRDMSESPPRRMEPGPEHPSQHSDGDRSVISVSRYRKNRSNTVVQRSREINSLSEPRVDVDKLYLARAGHMKQLLHSNLRVQRSIRTALSRVETFRNVRIACGEMLDLRLEELSPEMLALLVSDPAALVAKPDAHTWKDVDQRFDTARRQRKAMKRVLDNLREAQHHVKPMVPSCSDRKGRLERLFDDASKRLTDLKEQYKSEDALLRTVEEFQRMLAEQFQTVVSETSKGYEVKGSAELEIRKGSWAPDAEDPAKKVDRPLNDLGFASLELVGNHMVAPFLKKFGRQYLWPDVRDFVVVPYFKKEYEQTVESITWPRRTAAHWLRVCVLQSMFIISAKVFWDLAMAAWWLLNEGFTLRSIIAQCLFYSGTVGAGLYFLFISAVWGFAALIVVAGLIWWCFWFWVTRGGVDLDVQPTTAQWTSLGVMFAASAVAGFLTIARAEPLLPVGSWLGIEEW